MIFPEINAEEDDVFVGENKHMLNSIDIQERPTQLHEDNQN